MSVKSINDLVRGMGVVVALAIAAQAVSAAVFVPPTATGTTPSGLQWSTVATGSSLPVRSTTVAADGRPGAVVYWNTTTGLLQLDPKGWDLNAVIISYSPTTASILSTTPGPFSYATGTGANALSGATGLANQKTFPAASSAGDLPPTTYPARIGITGNLPGTQFGTVFTSTGDVGNIASTGTGGYWNQPWAFPSNLISSASSATMTMSDWRTYDLASNANANILGYGSQQAVFQYGINGVVGNQMGAVIPVSGAPTPTTLTWYGNGSTAGGSGNWTTTGNTWFDGSSVRSWVPGATAIFSGSSGGTVTLGEAVSADNGLQFTTSGYTLSGAALTLGGSTSNSVQVATGATATISAPISGSTGLVKTGAGTLALGGNNTFTGATTVQSGTLQISSNNAVATSAVTVPAGSGLKVDSGLTMKSPSITIAGALSASGVTLVVNGTSGIAQLVFSGTPATVTGAPNLAVSGGGVVSLPAVGRQTIAVTSLSVDAATGGKIDIGQGRIDVAVGGITEADLRADLIAGRSGGTFSGTTGIMTTGGKASVTSSNPAVGYRVLSSGAAIVAWAGYGDTNLDGQVNSADLLLMNNGGRYNAGSPATWVQGDFNYSNTYNSADILLMNNAALFGKGSFLQPFPSSSGLMAMVIGGDQDGTVFSLDSLDGFMAFDGTPLGAASAVPEPSMFAAIGICGLAAGAGLIRRRRFRGSVQSV